MNYIVKDFGLVYHEEVSTTNEVCNTVTTPGETCTSSNGSPNFPGGSETPVSTCTIVYVPSDADDTSNGVHGTATTVCTAGTVNKPGCIPSSPTTSTVCTTVTTVQKPAYYSLEPSTGWNAGADGYSSVIPDNYVLSWIMKSAVSGVVVGLNETNDYVTYQDINYAIYFSNGKYAYMRHGQLISNTVSYSDDTLFEIKKERDGVVFLVDGVVDYVIRETTPAFLYADCAVYASGDTIYGTIVYEGTSTLTNAQSNIEGFTNLEPLRDVSKYTGDLAGARFSGETTLEPLNSNITQYYSTTLPVPTGYATVGGAQGVNADLPTLYTAGYQDLLEPQVIGSNGYIVGITLDAQTEWYRYIEGAGILPNLWGYAAPDNHSSVSADIPTLWSISNVIPEGYWDNWALIQTPSFALEVEATVASASITNGSILVPSIEIEAQGGTDYAYIETPSLVVSAEATVNNHGLAEIQVPAKTLSIEVTIGTLASADIKAPNITLHGEDIGKNAAYLTVSDLFTINANLLVGQTLNSNIEAPRLELLSTATSWNYGTSDTVVPSFFSSWVEAKILVPRIILDAYEDDVIGSVNQVIVMNINTKDVTEYDNYMFDNIIEHNNLIYGVRSDGLYNLSGDLDIDQPIDSTFTFSSVDYDIPQYKFKPYVYFGLRTGDKLTYQPIVDEVTKLEFPIGIARNGGHRVQIAKGIKGCFWGATIKNVLGSDFELQSIDENIIESTRRV